LHTKNYNPENNISLNIGSKSVQINGFSRDCEIEINDDPRLLCKVTFPFGLSLKNCMML